jgi:hypothetical protein
LLLELEALDRALRQLQQLTPARHELLSLNAIKATSLTCQQPLELFLEKISQFEARLGTWNARNNRFRGFPRRMQWRMMYKRDAEELRSKLASHVGTINLLLMTQTVQSLCEAERDRTTFASGLESKIMAHQGLLEQIQDGVDTSLAHQLESRLRFEEQQASLEGLEDTAKETLDRVSSQQSSIYDIHSMVSRTQEQNNSVLRTSTNILNLLVSGMMTLRTIAQQMSRMFDLFIKFTTEMRAAVAELMRLFHSIQAGLRRIEASLPTRVMPPILQFTTALGDTMALPYQLCQEWPIFKELLGIIFFGKPGERRVEQGLYLIAHAQGGRIIRESAWKHSIKQDDHLSMAMILPELTAKQDFCPFPSCGASTEGTPVMWGGRSCLECGRWARLHRQESRATQYTDSSVYSTPIDKLLDKPSERTGTSSASSPEHPVTERGGDNDDANEDIELYRQIHVQAVERPSGMQPTSNEASAQTDGVSFLIPLRVIPPVYVDSAIQCELDAHMTLRAINSPMSFGQWVRVGLQF